MHNIGLGKLSDESKAKYPKYNSYLECMVRGQSAGLTAFVLSFSGVYFLQKLLKHKLPYKTTGFIAVSTAVSSVIAYKIVVDRCKSCQAAWTTPEEKDLKTIQD